MRDSRDLAEQRVLIFVPQHNAEGRKDVTGAFLPEARRLLRLVRRDSSILRFDNTLAKRKLRRSVLESFDSERDAYDGVAIFCHGWMDGIQLGFTRRTVDALAAAIVKATNGAAAPIVPLYCCSTAQGGDRSEDLGPGGGDDGFADRLRDALCQRGAVDCRVMGHTTVKHTTWNPDVMFMEGMGSAHGGSGGFPPVGRKSPLRRAWTTALRDKRKNNTLRLRMPYMSVKDIHQELAGG